MTHSRFDLHRRAFVVAGTAVASLPLTPAWSQDYPSKPVTFVVSFPPGSGTDTSARYYARRMQELSKQVFVVENRPGANSFIAAQAVARAAPDGYTLFFSGSSPVVANVVLFKKLPYDPVADFAPVASAVRATNLVVVPQNSPFKTLADLVAAAKAKPNSLNYASGSSAYQIATEMLTEVLGVKMSHVPYKGAAPALTDTVAGVTDVAVADITAALPLVTAGRLRALAVTSDKRIPLLPDLPTAMEAGAKGFQYYNWTGLFAPAKTPQPVIDKLADLMQKVAADPETAAFLGKLGGEVFPGGPQELRRLQLAEIEQWRSTAQRAGIRPE